MLMCTRCGTRYSNGTTCRQDFARLVPIQDDDSVPDGSVSDDAAATAGPEPDHPNEQSTTLSCPRCDATRADRAAPQCDYCGTTFAPKLHLVGPWGELEISDHPIELGRESTDRTVATALEAFDIVSRRHAVIAMREGCAWVTDLQSANGAYLNDELLQSGVPVPAAVGDVVRLGSRVRLYVRSADE